MTRYRRTYRNLDGQRIEGTWRHIFTRNMDTYFLTDLVIYADGAIDCGTGGLTDLDGLAKQLRCGRIATNLKDGAQASAHQLAGWRFTEPRSAINAEMLLGVDCRRNRPAQRPARLHRSMPASSEDVPGRPHRRKPAHDA